MSLSEYVKKEDLVRLFHLPMKEASKRLGVSESSLRNICRKHEIGRWPYRKFQQLDAHINSLRGVEDASMSSDGSMQMRGQTTPDDYARTKEMINALLTARRILEENPNMSLEAVILMANQQTNVSSQTAAVINSSILSQVSSCESPRVDPQELPTASSQRPVFVPKLFIPPQQSQQPQQYVSPQPPQPIIQPQQQQQQQQQQANYPQFRLDFVNFTNMFNVEANRQKHNPNIFEGSFAGGGSMSGSSTPSGTPRNFDTPSTPKIPPSELYGAPQQPNPNPFSLPSPSLIHPGYTTSGVYGGVNSNNTTPRGPNTKEPLPQIVTQPLTPKESAFQPYYHSHNSSRKMDTPKMDTPRPEPYPTHYTRNKGTYSHNIMDLHSQSLQRTSSMGSTSRYNNISSNFQPPSNVEALQSGVVLPPIARLEEYYSPQGRYPEFTSQQSPKSNPFMNQPQGPPLTSFLFSQPQQQFGPPQQQQLQYGYYRQANSMEE